MEQMGPLSYKIRVISRYTCKLVITTAFARCQTSAHKGSQQPQRSLVWLRVFGKPLALDRIPLCSRVVSSFSPMIK
eukprot:g12086.t1